jgi:hypothetical protein
LSSRESFFRDRLKALGGGAGSRDYRSTLKRGATCHAPNAGMAATLYSAIYFSPPTGAHVVSGDIL